MVNRHVSGPEEGPLAAVGGVERADPLLGQGTAFLGAIVLVGDLNGDEAPVQRVDDATVGERTRSQVKRAASAPSGDDPPARCRVSDS